MTESFEIAPVRAPLPSTKWLMCPRPDSSAPLRVWCVPFAGGGAAVWHPWAARLAGLAEIVAVRLPGREHRFSETACPRISNLMPALIELIAPFTNEDFVLWGHSFGGLVAFELARALRSRGLRPPQALIVSGVRAPHHPPDLPLLHPMPHREFVAEVERRYGAIPPEIRDHPEFLDLLLPVLRADLEAYETYRCPPAAPLAVPVLALGGADDANVSTAQLRDWEAYSAVGFEADILPGGHFFLQSHGEVTAKRIRQFLGRFATASGGERGGPAGLPQPVRA